MTTHIAPVMIRDIMTPRPMTVGPKTSVFLPDLSALWAEHVDDIMRRRVVTLAPDDPVAPAADHMLSSATCSAP